MQFPRFQNLILAGTFAGLLVTVFSIPTARAIEPNDAPKIMPTTPGDVALLADIKVAAKAHGRGHKLPPKAVSARRHKASNAKHGAHLKALPIATQAAYSSLTTGCVPPVGNQGQCGDCYNWSACKAATAANLTAGVLKPAPGSESAYMISPQFILDYFNNLGGCNGGDEYSVAQAIQSGGAPLMSGGPGPFYPGDGATDNGQNPQPTTGMTSYTLTQIVYCDPNQTSQGVASTQSIKNSVLAYGYVSVAVAAGDDWDNYTNGTITGRSNNINHAVGIVAWDDNHDNGDGSKGAWQMQNNWDITWGIKGYAWVKYGADSIGVEAFICITSAHPIPPGPAPAPPVPVPPTPVPPAPVPSAVTFPSGTYTVTGNANGSITLTPATSSKTSANWIAVIFDTVALFEAIKATGNAQLITDFQTRNWAKLAEDLMAIGTDPTVLQDLYNLADALGVQLPPLTDRYRGKVKVGGSACAAPAVVYAAPVTYSEMGSGACSSGTCAPQRRGLFGRRR